MSITPLSQATNSKKYGGKAANLAKLLQAGLPVPDGLAVGLAAFDDHGKLTDQSIQKINGLIGPNKLYAVRSSALVEDATDASWAGQFETFLGITPIDIIQKIESCHNSTKNRAKAYADSQNITKNFQIAVVIQEMLQPEYAGVLFTNDPITNENQLVIEYVEGLGESLVSGRSDPKTVILDATTELPFDGMRLSKLANKVEQLFGAPQDIEWAWANHQIWLLQARPITTTNTSKKALSLGEPDDLFYWGPSRANPTYMSDFMAAIERSFTQMSQDPELPTPPKTVVLFYDGKMVWLSNAQKFSNFTKKTFEIYEKRNQLDQDITKWYAVSQRLPSLSGQELIDELINAWFFTEFAEFALYGAETVLIERLSRFSPDERQQIWATFTIPDRPTFLNRIDSELVDLQDPRQLAIKYPWIVNGYDGINGDAKGYFIKRLKIIDTNPIKNVDNIARRNQLADQLTLTNDEQNTLAFTRKLIGFMDDRKAWMMQTRQLITRSVGSIKHGWLFSNKKSTLLDENATLELWQRYIDFKASTTVVSGLVASNGGKHFINGEVIIVASPTDNIPDNKIIVVPATSPSYVPLMRKAKALITDHGGIMSHAAIVAREFNLPCIVGTQQATKVLQTGDKVVLDLISGNIDK